MNENKTKDLSIVITGEAGQGIDTSADTLAKILKNCGYNIFTCKEYMSRVRGGCNSSEIRISSSKNFSFVSRIDLAVILTKKCFNHIKDRLSKDTIILIKKDDFPDEFLNEFLNVFYMENLEGLSKIYVNIQSIGIILGILDQEYNILKTYIEETFKEKGEDILKKNLESSKKGYDVGKNSNFKIEITGNRDNNEEDLFLCGNDAISLGCIAGGCNFISSYPMSPGTGILTFLANSKKDFEIIVEQAEDEIAAVNMALGAFYSGARAMVSTSGGGFALMCEAISLSGMTETPVVIHIGQRPGPATGLPTRTAQEDLNLALYSGHGEFPRVILTPGDLEECFYLSANAFNIADKFQIPVFILSDQYLLDAYYNINQFNMEFLNIENHIIETSKNYKRYELTENGISPRGIPNFGSGLVSVDSDEHDEHGHITENLDLRTKMVDKRLKKYDLIKKEAEEPVLYGDENYKTLILSYGSNKNVIKEALDFLNKPNLAFLHFKQAYPLHKCIEAYIDNAEKTVVIENNATSQFSSLVMLETGRKINQKILKYNGLPFSLEEIIEKIGGI